MPFTDAPWKTPESSLSPEEFCSVCLIDTNAGKEKVKANCKLPLRSRPGSPYNKGAIRNAMGRIFQMKGVPAADKRKAARRLVRLANEAGINVGPSVLRLAGMRSKE